MQVARGPIREDLGDPWLWFAVLAPPLAWLVHVAGMYALVPVSCTQGHAGLLHGFTALSAAPILGSWWIGQRIGRQVRAREDPAGRRVAFLSQLARISSPLFLAITLAEWIPVLVVGDPCR